MFDLKLKQQSHCFHYIKNCQTLIHQTHTKPQEILELKLISPKETFSFKTSINFGPNSNWTVGLTSLEVYDSIFNITEQNNEIQLYTDKFDVFSFIELKDDLKDIIIISDNRRNHLQNRK